MNGKNNDWMKLDEEGCMPHVLGRIARCPHCGRFMRRGLLNFLEHTWGDCPYHKTITYSPKK